MDHAMRGYATLPLFVAASLAASEIIRAQTPARDTTITTVAQPIGTAVVSGIVLSDDSTSQPLRRVSVSLVSGDLRVPLSTVTDDAGRFVFEGVPAGNYGVTASKPAYVGAFYGSKQPGHGPGVALAVRDGQRVTDVTLKMIRGGVISGTLRLPSQQPAQGMTVVVAEIETVGADRHLRLTGGRAMTDDRGEYRVYGLAPGDYIVQAQPSGLLSGALTGASDAPQTTAAEVSWAQQAAQVRAGVAGAGIPPSGSAPERGHTTNYATAYFPGTADPSGASVVSVGRSEEHGGVDFAMVLVSTARVSGVVLGPDGGPLPKATVSLVVRDDTLNVGSLLASRAAILSGADGSFTVPAVAPGHYRLSARSAPSVAGAPSVQGSGGVRPAVQAMAASASVGGASGDWWALQDLDVDGRDVPDVLLSMQLGMTVSGRVAFESSSRPAPTADDVLRARATFVPILTRSAAVDAIASGSSGVTATVAADGTFMATGIAPGPYRVRFTVSGMRVSPSASTDGWSLRSVMVGGVDIADRTLDIKPRENIRGVVATFTDRPTELSGTLMDQANRAAPGYPIIVFSTDRRDWRAGSRRVVEARPSTDGKFRLVGLPAGAYYVCAVVDLDPSALDDPSFLEQLVPSALTVTLTDGVSIVQNVKLGGGR
jgi:hypothetical protein